MSCLITLPPSTHVCVTRHLQIAHLHFPFLSFHHTQVTYSGDGVYLTLGLVCSGKASTHAALAENFRSAIYAFSKTAIYAPHSSGSASAVNAAVYVVAKAWYRSVSVSSSVVLGDSLNNFAQPARPQTLEDVFNGPYFVQKVCGGAVCWGMCVVDLQSGAVRLC